MVECCHHRAASMMAARPSHSLPGDEQRDARHRESFGEPGRGQIAKSARVFSYGRRATAVAFAPHSDDSARPDC